MKNTDLRVGRRQLRRMVAQGIRDLADRVVNIQSTCMHLEVYECPPTERGLRVPDEHNSAVRICKECGLSETISHDGYCSVLFDHEGRTVTETTRRRLHALKMGMHINQATGALIGEETLKIQDAFEAWKRRGWFLLDNLTPCS